MVPMAASLSVSAAGFVGRIHTVGEVVVGKGTKGMQNGLCHSAQGFTHGLTGHLTLVESAHAVAHHKHTVVAVDLVG